MTLLWGPMFGPHKVTFPHGVGVYTHEGPRNYVKVRTHTYIHMNPKFDLLLTSVAS